MSEICNSTQMDHSEYIYMCVWISHMVVIIDNYFLPSNTSPFSSTISNANLHRDIWEVTTTQDNKK